MSTDTSETGATRETPDEARDAIASALEFLQGEAVALGMRDVSTLLALAQSCIRENYAKAGTTGASRAN